MQGVGGGRNGRMGSKCKKREKLKSWWKRSGFIEKISEINKHLSKLAKNKREKTQITNTRNEPGDIIIDCTYKHEKDNKRIL